MTLVSLTDCCHLLAIDLKTLHRWMTLSRFSTQSHPLDARLKCLTSIQIQQLATTHRRVLPDFEQLRGQSWLLTASTSASLVPDVPPDLFLHVTDLTKQLSTLHAQVAALQYQLTQLTEQLQKEQEWRINQARALQEKSQESSRDHSQQSSQEKSRQSSQKKSQESIRAEANTSSIDRRKRSHVLPLVEYGGTDGKYVVISPEQGLLAFEPDSPEWFAWLSTLISFRFVGASGHLTVHRDKCSPRWSWRATRSIRSRSRSLHLVTTECLTIAVLEQAAASLQSLLN
jgi:hypothetical protein